MPPSPAPRDSIDFPESTQLAGEGTRTRIRVFGFLVRPSILHTILSSSVLLTRRTSMR